MFRHMPTSLAIESRRPSATRLRPKADRQRLQLVDELRLGVLGRARELDLREARQGLLEQDPELESSQRGAEAEVPTSSAERLVLGVAGDVEAIGVLVTRLVAVRRHVPHHHLLALADRVAAELGIAGGRAP